MPIYGFICQDCHQHFEVLRPVSQVDEAPPVCEFCGSPHTNRKLGSVMVIFSSGADRKVIGSSSCGSCSQSSSSCSSCSSNRR